MTENQTPLPSGWRSAMAVALVFVLTAPAAVGGGMAMAPIAALGGLLGVPVRRFGRIIAEVWPILLALAVFLVWAGITTTWSATAHSMQIWKLTGGIVTGAAFIAACAHTKGHARDVAVSTGIVCVLALAALLAVEALADMPINRLFNPTAETGALMRNPGKGSSILVILVWGVMGACVGSLPWRRIAWRVALISTAVLSLQFDMATNAAGFATGLIAFLFTYKAPRLGLAIATICSAGWILVAPFVTPLVLRDSAFVDRMPDSWRMRLMIWRNAEGLIEQKPLTGWGLDAARSLGSETGNLDGLRFNILPLHPHSMSYHVWLELGGIGAVLLAVAFCAAGLVAAKRLADEPPRAAALAAVIVTFSSIWFVSYGAWQEWWIGVVIVGAGFALFGREKPGAAESVRPARPARIITSRD